MADCTKCNKFSIVQKGPLGQVGLCAITGAYIDPDDWTGTEKLLSSVSQCPHGGPFIAEKEKVAMENTPSKRIPWDEVRSFGEKQTTPRIMAREMRAEGKTYQAIADYIGEVMGTEIIGQSIAAAIKAKRATEAPKQVSPAPNVPKQPPQDALTAFLEHRGLAGAFALFKAGWDAARK